MNLLAGTYYDPAASVSKATTANLAMTALDTTNLRLTFTAPPSGRVKVIIRGGAIHGATTFPQILVGCLESSPSAGTVRGRMPPQGGGFNGTAVATTHMPVAVEYIITGLTPGQAYTWDAAYGVETLIAATGWKYGGPNNTTANDAWGGISFEIWDPSPVYTPSAGAAPTNTVHVKLDALPTAAVVADAVWDEAISGHLTAGTTGEKLNAAGAGGDPWSTALPGAYAAGTAGNILGNRLDAAITTRHASGAAVASVSGAVGSVTGAVTVGTINANVITAASIAASALDNKGNWNVGKTGYSLTQTFPTNFSALTITAGGAVTAGTVSDKTGYSLANGSIAAATFAAGAITATVAPNLDAAISSRLASASYTAPANADIAAIKTKTDSLTFTVAGKLDVNVLVVNGVTIQGAGTSGDKWRPV